MKFKLLIDENVDNRIVNDLQFGDFELVFIAKRYTGISDRQIIEFARKECATIITEDKDFGEWVFAYHQKIGVVFLRYSASGVEKIRMRKI